MVDIILRPANYKVTRHFPSGLWHIGTALRGGSLNAALRGAFTSQRAASEAIKILEADVREKFMKLQKERRVAGKRRKAGVDA